MAEVFLAKTLGAEGVAKLVAVKRILPQFSKSEEFIAMFKEEAKIAVNLAHPNICTIIEFGIEHEQFYIAMEYVEGRNLRQILNRMKELNKSFSAEQAVYVINETARGLDHAHRCIEAQTGKPLNIIHRDISPQNVMLSFEANVKVVDFGIAKAESQAEATRAGTLKGKFSYMSPEQAEGLDIDSRTDIFSLGIVLWEILANDRLFLANNEMNTLRKIKECHIPSLHKLDPKISTDLEKIVNKSLARDKNLRYQSSGEFTKDLNSYLNRNHPDFSPQDFSIFMKQLFAEELLESRRKLIEYAKVSFNRQSEEKTVYIDVKQGTNTHTQAATATRTPLEDSGRTPGINIVNEGTDTANRRISTMQPVSGRFRDANQMPLRSGNTTTGLRPVIRPVSPSDRSGSRSVYTNTASGYGAPKSGSSFSTFFLFIIVASAAYLFMGNPEMFNTLMCRVSTEYCKPTRSTNTATSPSVVSRPEPPVAGSVRVTIASMPPGAQITVNGVIRGTTPMELEFPQNQTVTLALKREGFLDKTQAIRPSTNGQTYTFDLQKMKTGYLSIRVVPGDAEIYVNDVKLAQPLPINMLPVQANTQLKIRAINQYTGTGDEKIVTVREDSHQMIDLFLKKPERVPSNKK